MKRKVVIAVIAAALVVIALVVLTQQNQPQRGVKEAALVRAPQAITGSIVPAHYETAREKASLAPTLTPRGSLPG